MNRPFCLFVLLLSFSGAAAAQAPPPSGTAAAHPSSQASAAPVLTTSAAPGGDTAHLSARQQQLLDNADQLVALAQQLKVEVGKGNEYTLSLNAVRRAEDIEKLARNLQKQLHRNER